MCSAIHGVSFSKRTMPVDMRTPVFPVPLSRTIIRSPMRGTLRGLHYQEPHAQGKLVMVTEGAVYDVVVDIRKGAPSFGRWYGVELSAENRRQVYVPPGCAHGFCVTSERASFLYKCTDYYAPSDERGIIWNDPVLAIPWPVAAPILSAKDQTYKSMADMESELPRYRPVG